MSTHNLPFVKDCIRGIRGFSLIEVVIAIGIFGFAALAVLGSLASLFSISKNSCDETTAAHIARQIFSDLQPDKGSYAGAIVRESDSTTADLRENGDFSAFYTADGRPSHRSDPSCLYEATVTLIPFIDPTDTLRTGLSEVKIRIAPAGGPTKSVPTYEFLTRLAAKAAPRS